MGRTYRVKWEIDIEIEDEDIVASSDNAHYLAAYKAHLIQRDLTSEATVFEVAEVNFDDRVYIVGPVWHVDLDENLASIKYIMPSLSEQKGE